MFEEEKISNIVKTFDSGKTQQAITELLKLIKKYPDKLEYTFLYGKMCNSLNRLDEAEKIFLHLINKNKSSIDFLKNLYIVYLKNNQPIKAEKYILKILKKNNDDYDSLRDLGYINFLQKKYNLAESIFKRILKKIDHDIFALNVYGLICYFLDNVDEAINYFVKAIKLNPNYLDSYNNLGKIYFDLEDIDKAFYNFKKAYKLNRDFPQTLTNIGNILSLKDKNYNSILAYKKAMGVIENNPELLANISIAYSRIADFENSLKYYKEANKYKSTNISLNLSLSYLYLYKNKYIEAWKLFDSRIHNNKFFKKKYNQKLITHILKNKQNFNKNDKLLILREQGVGEEILFSSIYPDLINYSQNVTIECDPRLIKIFERSFEKNIFVEDGKFSKSLDGLKKFDSVIFAGSLCKKFRKTHSDFSRMNYLISDKTKDIKINQSIEKDIKKLRVGLSWKSVVSIYGKLKSLSLYDFKNLFTNNRQFINLQYGDVKDEIEKFKSENYEIYSCENIDLFNDLEGCMSLLKNLDVFVTVSNTTAHIAAAMGVKTILICPKKSSTYFYWNNERNITPWYNNVEIIKVSGSINNTIKKVDNILKEI